MGKNSHLGPNTTLGYKIAKSHFMDHCVYIMSYDKGCPSFDKILIIPLFPQRTEQPCMLPRATPSLQNFFGTDNPAAFLSTKENMQEVVALTKTDMLSSLTISHGCISRHRCPESPILLQKCILHILDCLTHNTGARTLAFCFYLFTTGNLKYKYTGWKPGSSEVEDKILIDFCRQRTSVLLVVLYCSWLRAKVTFEKVLLPIVMMNSGGTSKHSPCVQEASVPIPKSL